MDQAYFDNLARSVASGGGARRAVLRLLAGGALCGLSARLGLDDVAAAKEKKPKHKRRQQPQRRNKRQAEQHGHLRDEGKRKKKRKKKPPPLPPGCQSCGNCEMCRDGACAPDPELNLVRCLESPQDPGGQCHMCQNGVCVPQANGSRCRDGDECSWCQDGVCVPVRDKQLSPCGNDPCKRCLAGRCTSIGNGSTCQLGSVTGACCSGLCFDLDHDRNNCGQCGNRCNSGDQCRQGTCQPPCPAPCDDECCQQDESCVLEWTGSRYIRRCCDSDKLVGGQCCDGDKSICGNNQLCCPAGSTCYQDSGGLWLCCHGTLCGQHRCCTGATTCHTGCDTPDGTACCIGESGCGCCRDCTP